MAQKVGFIGLGTMGRPFATNIVKAGFDLTVYDVRPEPVKELVGLGPEVDALMHGPDGLLAGVHQGLIMVIHSSMHPRDIKQVADEAQTHGVEVLDAQMSGGRRGVEAKTLCLMVGGARDDRWEYLLAGRRGNGRRCKDRAEYYDGAALSVSIRGFPPGREGRLKSRSLPGSGAHKRGSELRR